MSGTDDYLAVFGWLLLSIAVVTTLMAWMWRFRSRLWHRNNAMLLLALALLTATTLLVVTGDGTVVALPGAHLRGRAAALGPARLPAWPAWSRPWSRSWPASSPARWTWPPTPSSVAWSGTIVIGRGERLSSSCRPALVITAANIAVVTAFTIIVGSQDLEIYLQLLAASAISAFGAAVAAAGTFAVLGSVFGITTSYQLLELANPTQPLLRRLLLEAPGTYHHSLMVGNLAEQAAEAIGADALVTRVAAYYHDVGKLYDPHASSSRTRPAARTCTTSCHPEESAAMIVGPRGARHRHRLPVQAAQGAHRLHPPAPRHRARWATSTPRPARSRPTRPERR